jgi:plastocyanin
MNLLSKSLLSLSLITASQILFAQARDDKAAGVTTVEMRSISFAPKIITIEPGQSVVWKNVSLTDHSATSSDDTRPFDTTMVNPKASSKPVMFSQAGEYPYLCKLHGRTMSGLVVVKAKK